MTTEVVDPEGGHEGMTKPDFDEPDRCIPIVDRRYRGELDPAIGQLRFEHLAGA